MLMALIKKGNGKGGKRKSPGDRDLDFSGSTGFKIFVGNQRGRSFIDRIQQVFFGYGF